MSAVKELFKCLSQYFKIHPIVEAITVFLIGFLFICFVNFIFGWGMMSGDSKFYSSLSCQFESEGWAAFEVRNTSFYYRLFPLLLWVCRSVDSENWVFIFTVFQSLVVGFYFLGVFSLSRSVFKDPLSGWFAIGLILPLYDFWNWSCFVLSDILFSTCLLWFLYGIHLLSSESGKLRKGILFVIIFLPLLVFLRPVGLFAVAAVVFYGFYQLQTRLFSSKLANITLLFLLLLVTIGGISFYVYAPENFLIGPTGFFKKMFEEGVVIHDREYHNLNYSQWIIESDIGRVGAYLFLFFARLLMFWSPYVHGYSLIHALFNMVSLLPIYILAFFSPNKHSTHLFWSIVVGFSLFHSLTLIDFDHRYRVPLLGILVVLASGGLCRIAWRKSFVIQDPLNV